MNKHIVIGKANAPVHLLGEYGNRHGLIAGATGTGKTVTLMTLAEGFSRMGSAVFVADVKGDMSGLAMAGEHKDKIVQRVQDIGIEGFEFKANPVTLWDLWGERGLPVKTTIEAVGATLMARMMELNDTQEGVLEVVFHYAKSIDYNIDTLDDLRELLVLVSEERADISKRYGMVSDASIGTIQRNLLRMESEGLDNFFGNPMFYFDDLIRTNDDGQGFINILSAESLILKPRIYSTFLLWLLTSLFEKLPEIGDVEVPKLVFFFDEAHLLFDDCPPALMRRIEQVVRLIRSKGVGVYFCSQNPDDIPETILGQLGNRVQHALRAFTPRDQKAVKAAAETFASNPNIDVREVIKNMGVGEALVSMLDSKGTPTAVQRAIISPPGCRLGPITDDERQELVDGSELADDYEDLSKLSHEERMSRIFYDPNTQDSHGNPLPQDEIVRIAKEKAEAKAARKAEREALWNPSPDDEPELDSFWQTFWKVLTFR